MLHVLELVLLAAQARLLVLEQAVNEVLATMRDKGAGWEGKGRPMVLFKLGQSYAESSVRETRVCLPRCSAWSAASLHLRGKECVHKDTHIR